MIDPPSDTEGARKSDDPAGKPVPADAAKAAALALRARIAAGWGGAKRWLPFLAACVVAFALEHSAIAWIGGHDRNSALTQGLFSVRAFYGYAVSTWPRELLPRYTAIVHINPESDPTAEGLANNVCSQRDYLAHLLPAIAELQPTILVIDKYFTSRGCVQAGPTGRLVDAVAAVSARLPVVVGLKAPESADDAPGSTAAPVLLAPLAFADLPSLKQGLVNIDLLPQRIPLGWTVRADAKSKAEWRNGIALETALVREPDLLAKAPRLQRLKDARDNPYASMIAQQNFTVLQASDILCSDKSAAAAFAGACAGLQRPLTEPRHLRGRIVILGETGVAIDRHETMVIGRVPGTVLQANYIEALLDERYFVPSPEWLDYFVGLLVFIGLEAALRKHNPLVALGLVAAIFVTTFLLLSLIARYLGYYVGPAVSLLVLVFLVIGWIRESIIRKGESAT